MRIVFVRFDSTAVEPPTPEKNCLNMSMEHPDSLVKIIILNKAVLQQSSAKTITSARIWVPIELAWRNDKHI
jgi:hypothetical protein